MYNIKFKPQVIGDLLRVHFMVRPQAGNILYRDSRPFYAGPTAADERMRGDARRQLVKLDALNVFKDIWLLALYLFIDALLRHCIVLRLPGIAPAAPVL
ncbi:MAG: hypothetical protein OXG84_07030 [Chloroflexi bacterium]|nr:hypothetical protein [Chloroflexota bacterium]